MAVRIGNFVYKYHVRALAKERGFSAWQLITHKYCRGTVYETSCTCTAREKFCIGVPYRICEMFSDNFSIGQRGIRETALVLFESFQMNQFKKSSGI